MTNQGGLVMDKFNIFLCYRGEQAGLLARSIYLEIKSYKNNKLKVFYAPECIKYGEDFVERCKEVASRVSLMVTFITQDFFSKVTNPDDVVALEIRSALNNPNCTFLPIIFKDFDFKTAVEQIKSIYTPDEIKRIAHINAINYTDVYSFDSFSLLGAIFQHFSVSKDEIDEDAAQKRMMVDDEQLATWVANNAERRRQQIQAQLMLKYDSPVYEKLLKGKNNLNVLDLGSGNGSTIMARLGNRSEVRKIIGLEKTKELVDQANAQYGSDRVKFYQLDVECDDFVERVQEIMDENDIEAFDFVNVLSLLSYLTKTSHLFKNIKKISSEGSVIIVRNIDDGLNMAFPDEDGDFKKAMGLLQLCVSNGYRFDGRQIFNILQIRGYKDIVCENLAINTVGMSTEDKEAFFVTVFGFAKKGIKDELIAHPDSIDLQEKYQWLTQVYDKLEEKFMNPAFFLNFGFMIYSARIK